MWGVACYWTPNAFGRGKDPELTAEAKIAPAEGMEKVEPIKPDWCEPYKGQMQNLSSPVQTVKAKVSQGYSPATLQSIAWAACDDPSNPVRQQWVAAWRQGFVNYLGWTEQEDRSAMKVWALETNELEANFKELCKKMQPDPAAAPPEKANNLARFIALKCASNFPSTTTKEIEYWLDRKTEISSELARAGLVMGCFGDLIYAGQIGRTDMVISAFAHCGPDARRLDKGRFEKELASLALGPVGDAMARTTFAKARNATKLLTTELKKLAEREPELQAILFDIPEQGFTAWEALYRKNQTVFDAVTALEDKSLQGSKKAYTGCGPGLWKLLVDTVSAQKPANSEAMREILAGPVVSPLLGAMVVCDANEERYLRASMLHTLIGRREWRGPRMAAYWAVVDQLSTVTKDRENFPLSLSNFGKPFGPSGKDRIQSAIELTFNQLSGNSDEEGVVKSINPEGEGFRVSFKTETWMTPVMSCIETNKIDTIDEKGHVFYRQICKPAGSKQVSHTPEPVWIAKDLATGIKTGSLIVFLANERNPKREAFPKEVYTSKAKDKLLCFYGFAL